MTVIYELLKRLFPNKIISYRLSDLIHQSSNGNEVNSHICISIENDKNTRQFLYMTIDELIVLYQNCIVSERSLYELIPPTKQVKAYMDIEYYIENNLIIQNSYTVISSCLKMFCYLLNFQNNMTFESKDWLDAALQQCLVVEASTSEKVSFHFIHANPFLLFESNVSFGLYIKVVIHLFLFLTAQHKCSYFDINFTLQKYSISDLIKLITPYVKELRISCTECYLFLTNITVADIAHLIVLNKQNESILAIDLNVYSKNQQFRLFDCVKRNKNNPLIQAVSFPFNNNSKNSYYEILQKSIITNTDSIDVPLIYLINNEFICKLPNKKNSLSSSNDNLIKLNNINTHISKFFICKASYTSTSNTNTSNVTLQTITQNTIDPFQEETQQFTAFVNTLIKSDKAHQGYIRSCVRGNRNTNVLFFNIGGEYRFCTHKGTHHQHNQTAILVDIKNSTYTIRCKDPNCDNTLLLWNKIEQIN